MKLLDDVRLPIGLTPQWCDALAEELEIAERGLPELSPAALELAELAVSGEYDAEIVGSVLERDDKLREQVGMRALWEIAVIDVARLKVFGPVLGQVLGGARMWSIARLAGAISHRLSSAKLGRSRASILAGLILCVGPPLAHQLIRRVEDKTDELLPSRMRREVSNRIGPALGVALVRAWSLSASIESAAHAFADGRGELPIDREAQVAVFSVSMARYVTARGTDSLAIPLRWPTAVALGITEPELKGIVDAAANADANPLLP